MNPRDVLEERRRLINTHRQHIGNRGAFETHLQCLPVEPFATTPRARHKQVAEKIHLNPFHTETFTKFAASRGRVETEATGVEPTRFCFARRGKDFAYLVQDARIGRRATARTAADRRLVDRDHFVEVLHAADPGVRSRRLGFQAKVLSHRRSQSVIDQRAFAAAGHPADADEQADGELYSDLV